jgi:DNA-binding NarL/FixJ family response regulator
LLKVRVVILTAHSLFTEGIATRLKQHLDQIELQVVDSQSADAMARTIAAQPAVVVFEAHDEHVECSCPLAGLLDARPALKIIRLDPSHDQIQIVTSEQRAASKPMDLINMLLSSA